MFEQTTSGDIRSVTSSQVLGCGVLPCEWPDGPMTSLSGQVLAPASLTPLPEDSKVRKTKGTYGPSGSASSPSLVLQQFTESRLLMQLPKAGWTASMMTWKRKATPSGRLYCQLAVSAPRTAGTDCGLWVSPTAQDHSRGVAPSRLQDKGIPLTQQVGNIMALWQTPVADDSVEREKGKFNSRGEPKLSAQALWPTATSNCSTGAGTQGRDGGMNLQTAAMWATPSSRDWKDSPGMSKEGINPDGSQRTRMDQLPRQIPLETSNGSPAPTEKRGQLNPEFVSWLMGIPNEFHSSMLSGMQSCPKSRRNSSKPRPKSKESS